MAVVAFTGFESGKPLVAGTRNEAWNSSAPTGGIVDVTEEVARSGRFSLKCWSQNTTNTNLGANLWYGTAAAPTSGYFTFWFRIGVTPTAVIQIAGLIVSGPNDGNALIQLNTNRTLQLRTSTGGHTYTNAGSPSAALTVGTWYRIDWSATGIDVAGNFATELKLNGTSVASASGLTLSTTGTVQGLVLGYSGDPFVANSAFYTTYFDDVMFRDDAFEATDGGVLNMRPDSAGNYTGWTGTFADADEVPPNDATDFVEDSTTTAAETYGLKATSALGIAGAIVAVKPWIVAQRGATAGVTIKPRIRSGTTDVDTDDSATSTTMSSTLWHYNGIKCLETDPNTSAAWTLAGLDALEAGVVCTGATAGQRKVTALGVMVWCASPPSSADSHILGFSGFETGSLMAAANVQGEWTGGGVATGGTIGIVSTVRRSGRYSMRSNATSATNAIRSSYLAATASGLSADNYFTLWLRIAARPTTNRVTILTMGASGTFEAAIDLLPTGELQLCWGSSPLTDVGSPSAVLALNTWHRIDLKAVYSQVVGELDTELRVNGASVASDPAIAMPSGAIGRITSFTVGSSALHNHNDTWDLYVDDFMWRDDQFHPDDGGCVLLHPTAQGTYSGWTGTFADVDDSAADEDTTFISSSTLTAVETYLVETPAAVGSAGDIVAAFPFMLSRRAATNGVSIGLRLRQGGIDYDTPAFQHTVQAYTWRPGRVRERDPDTNSAWTSAGLGAVEVGPFEGGAVTGEHRVTQTGIMFWTTAWAVPAPIVASVTPNSGPKTGGTAVTISGANFTGATAVTIGGVDATSVVVVSDGSITCTTAAVQKAGTYDVIVSADGGTGYLPLAFTYTPGNSNGNGGNNAGGLGTLVVPTPTSPAPANGDIMYAFITVRVTTTTVVQASWGTEIHSRSDGTNSITRVFRKVASSEPANYTFTLGTTQKASGVIMSVPADVDLTTQQIASQANASSVNCVAPGLTPLRLGAVSIFCAGTAIGTTVTPPTSYTEPAGADSASTGGSANTRTTTEGAYRTLASLAATGTLTGVAAAAATNVGIQIMLDVPNPDSAALKKAPLAMLLPQ